MKISYRNNLGLKIVETGFFMADIESEFDSGFIKSLRKKFETVKESFKPIKIISKNMAEAIQSSADKMIKDEIWDNVGSVNGTIIMNGFTFCFAIDSKGKPEHDHVVFVFYGGKILGYGWQDIQCNKRMTVIPKTSQWLLEHVKHKEGNAWQEDIFDGLYTHFNFCS